MACDSLARWRLGSEPCHLGASARRAANDYHRRPRQRNVGTPVAALWNTGKTQSCGFLTGSSPCLGHGRGHARRQWRGHRAVLIGPTPGGGGGLLLLLALAQRPPLPPVCLRCPNVNRAGDHPPHIPKPAQSSTVNSEFLRLQLAYGCMHQQQVRTCLEHAGVLRAFAKASLHIAPRD